MASDYLTAEDVAEKLGLSLRFVHDELRRKNLRGINVARQWRIEPADLKTYMDAKANVRVVRRSA